MRRAFDAAVSLLVAVASTTVAIRPRVLVLMASYNGERWIGEQLDSIAAQSGAEVAIRVCDDGSSDGTLACVEAARARGVAVALHRSTAAGGSASRNFLRLIREADFSGFDHVALADQDDIWYPGHLARAVERLRLRKCDAGSAAVRAVWPNGRTRVLRQESRVTRADYLFEGAGQGCSFVMRADGFARLQAELRKAQAQAWNVRYHDWLLYALARVLGMQWDFDPAPCMDYRQHAGNDTGARGPWAATLKRFALIRSGWYARQIDAVLSVCEATASSDGPAAEVRHFFANHQSICALWQQVAYVWRHSRRKSSDRAMLMFAAASGWLTLTRKQNCATPAHRCPAPKDQ